MWGYTSRHSCNHIAKFPIQIVLLVHQLCSAQYNDSVWSCKWGERWWLFLVSKATLELPCLSVQICNQNRKSGSMLRPGRPRSTTAVYFALFCSCFIIYFAAKKRFPLFAKMTCWPIICQTYLSWMVSSHFETQRSFLLQGRTYTKSFT